MHARSVRGILEDRKTQTRRMVFRRGREEGTAYTAIPGEGSTVETILEHFRCPYGQPGDRLWVRETWALPDPTDQRTICYRASGHPITTGARWRPSIHMPRWACRLVLEVTAIRVELVQDITVEDVIAEGLRIPISPDRHALLELTGPVDPMGFAPRHPREWQVADFARHYFANRWTELNGKRGFGWTVNPWVWVIAFRRVEAPSR